MSSSINILYRQVARGRGRSQHLLDPTVAIQLKRLAAENETTVQALLGKH
ncbi:ribbon-helix-helix domain-containing protein [Tolypothrix bouteillei VB521301_2]